QKEKKRKVEKQRLTQRGWKRNIRSLATTQKTGNGSEGCNCSLTIYQTICVGTPQDDIQHLRMQKNIKS
ncbi:hypothetical protein Q4R30_16365, partial [Morganella morganii]